MSQHISTATGPGRPLAACANARLTSAGAFVGESKEDSARLVHDTERENVAEIEIKAQDDAAVCTRPLHDLRIRSPLQAERSHTSCFMTKLF